VDFVERKPPGPKDNLPKCDRQPGRDGNGLKCDLMDLETEWIMERDGKIVDQRRRIGGRNR
jgi:hypothetical protein